jgi:hypothetical protein
MNDFIKKTKEVAVMKNRRRRKSLDHAGAVSYVTDRNERFVLRKCAVYLDHLLETYLLADRETIKLLAWVMGPKMNDLGQILLKSSFSISFRPGNKGKTISWIISAARIFQAGAISK